MLPCTADQQAGTAKVNLPPEVRQTVRHPPRSGWLDELGRLKDGRSLGLGVARCAPYWVVQNCPAAPSAVSCSRMYVRTCSSSNPTVDTADFAMSRRLLRPGEEYHSPPGQELLGVITSHGPSRPTSEGVDTERVVPVESRLVACQTLIRCRRPSESSKERVQEPLRGERIETHRGIPGCKP